MKAPKKRKGKRLERAPDAPSSVPALIGRNIPPERLEGLEYKPSESEAFTKESRAGLRCEVWESPRWLLTLGIEKGRTVSEEWEEQGPIQAPEYTPPHPLEIMAMPIARTARAAWEWLESTVLRVDAYVPLADERGFTRKQIRDGIGRNPWRLHPSENDLSAALRSLRRMGRVEMVATDSATYFISRPTAEETRWQIVEEMGEYWLRWSRGFRTESKQIRLGKRGVLRDLFNTLWKHRGNLLIETNWGPPEPQVGMYLKMARDALRAAGLPDELRERLIYRCDGFVALWPDAAAAPTAHGRGAR